MDSIKKIAFFQRQLEIHIKLAFKPEAWQVWHQADIRYVSWNEACGSRGYCLAIPIDLAASIEPQTPWQVPFDETKLTLWNPVPAPQGTGWSRRPESGPVIWYLHETGTVMPAWDLFNTLIDLLTLREEREISKQDEHGRFISDFSPRYRANLLRVPAFNEAVAALVGALAGLSNKESPRFEVSEWVLKPAVVLSHDCDLLRGNDLITQLIRLYRCLLPVSWGKMPDFKQLLWMAVNVYSPKRYYYDDIRRMINIERQYGYHSIFYFLNGSCGRFGARSGSAIVSKAAELIPLGWEIGMHYNYDTYLNATRFSLQKYQLRNLTRWQILSGRAHYLRFNPQGSFEFLAEQGIRLDESLGYPSYSGYRAGIAGVYELPISAGGHSLLELPLVFMDGTLADEEIREGGSVFLGMLHHLEKIGGVLSILSHPGNFQNPEFPEHLGFYKRLLNEVYRRQCRSLTPGELMSIISNS